MDITQLLWASSPYAILLAYAAYALATRRPAKSLQVNDHVGEFL